MIRVFKGLKNKILSAELIRGALGVGGLKLISLPLTLATSVLLARALGPDAFGRYVFVMAAISLLALPVGPGIGQLIIREVAKYQHKEEWGLFLGILRRGQQYVILGSAVVITGIAVSVYLHADWSMTDRWTLLLIASPLVPLLGLNVLKSTTLRGLRFPSYSQLPDLICRPGFHVVFLGILLAVGQLSAGTALASQIAALALALLVGAWILRRHLPQELGQQKPSYRTREWARAVLPFTILAAVGTLNGQIGILVLGWLGTDENVAALQVAQSGSMLVAISLVIVNFVIGPHITHAFQDGNKTRLQELSRRSARAALLVSLPIALPLIFFGGPIVEFIYGNEYSGSVTFPLAILALGQLFNVAFGSVALFLSMSGHERDTLTGQLVALVVTSVGALVLIPLYGATGAAISVSSGLVVWNLILAFMVAKRLNIHPTAF